MASLSVSSSKKDWADPEIASLFERGRVLPPSFYERHTVEVSRDLLGKILVVSTRSGVTAARIVETEAYRADDPASHSCRGETPRSAVMFGDPGVAYVYFIYGMYEMLNFVTEPKGHAGAALIRAAEPVAGIEWMRKRRRSVRKLADLTAGPGKLTRAMGIKMTHNRTSLQGPELFVLDDGFRVENVSVSGRIGIRVAQEVPWRFFASGNPFVSSMPQPRVRRPQGGVR